jgi:hypothetical protein
VKEVMVVEWGPPCGMRINGGGVELVADETAGERRRVWTGKSSSGVERREGFREATVEAAGK